MNQNSIKKILLVGCTGYIGSHVLEILIKRKFLVICIGRNLKKLKDRFNNTQSSFIELNLDSDVEYKDLSSKIQQIDAIVSCIGSRTGGIADSWQVEYEINKKLLNFSELVNCKKFVLLSAICVQKPKLSFQFAKIKFENLLISSNITYSIVRPTAYFKSLAGQVQNVIKGKSFIVFDNGKKTACKPISESDLATFICDCLTLKDRENKILPIGGKGPSISPLEQGELIFKLLNKSPKITRVPSQVFNCLSLLITPLTFFSKKFKDLKEFLQIGKYYATESMLLWDPNTKTYSSKKTPEFGNETLENFYGKIIKNGISGQELGHHKLF